MAWKQYLEATQNYMTSLEPLYEEIFQSWYSELFQIDGADEIK